jgi:serine/threonine-protein kinase
VALWDDELLRMMTHRRLSIWETLGRIVRGNASVVLALILAVLLIIAYVVMTRWLRRRSTTRLEDLVTEEPEGLLNEALTGDPIGIALRAQELAPVEKREFIEKACGGDTKLWRDVDSLIRAVEASPETLAPPPERPIELPESIGPYNIEGILGRGAMAIVYLATDNIHRDVAVKVLTGDVGPISERPERFRREAELLVRIRHPNIPVVYAFDEHDGLQYNAMERIQGVSLSKALEAAHGEGIIHRDLKPSNIMISVDGKVKVLDLGIGAILGGGKPGTTIRTLESSPGSTLLGTLGYMAPEQMSSGRVDHRVDIWAIGCVLYECLTGRPAFPPTMKVETLSEGPDWYRLPLETPKRVRSLLRGCLEPDPLRRISAMSDVRSTLEMVISSPLIGFPWVAKVVNAILMPILVLRKAAQQARGPLSRTR